MGQFTRLPILVSIFMLVFGSAFAADLGIRGGITRGPDQFHVGAHARAGEVVQGFQFVPNFEIGAGDDLTLIAINGDMIHEFFGSDTSQWGFFAGGGLALNYLDWDAGQGHDGSDVDLGLNALCGLSHHLSSGNQLFVELRLGLMDSPDTKVTVGLTFK